MVVLTKFEKCLETHVLHASAFWSHMQTKLEFLVGKNEETALYK